MKNETESQTNKSAVCHMNHLAEGELDPFAPIAFWPAGEVTQGQRSKLWETESGHQLLSESIPKTDT